MKSIERRGRGRPRGSGLNDEGTLSAIADMIARSPGLPPTTALRRIDPDVNPASKRRIQSKWKEQRARLLAESRLRLSMKDQGAVVHANAAGGNHNGSPTVPATVGTSIQSSPLASQLAAAEIARCATAAAQASARLSAAMSSPAAQMIRDVHNSEAMRLMREVHDSPSMRLMREIYDSPAMRAMRELQDSPAMRAVRELNNSPAMRAAQDAHLMVTKALSL